MYREEDQATYLIYTDIQRSNTKFGWFSNRRSNQQNSEKFLPPAIGIERFDWFYCNKKFLDIDLHFCVHCGGAEFSGERIELRIRSAHSFKRERSTVGVKLQQTHEQRTRAFGQRRDEGTVAQPLHELVIFERCVAIALIENVGGFEGTASVRSRNIRMSSAHESALRASYTAPFITSGATYAPLSTVICDFEHENDCSRTKSNRSAAPKSINFTLMSDATKQCTLRPSR